MVSFLLSPGRAWGMGMAIPTDRQRLSDDGEKGQCEILLNTDPFLSGPELKGGGRANTFNAATKRRINAARKEGR